MREKKVRWAHFLLTNEIFPSTAQIADVDRFQFRDVIGPIMAQREANATTHERTPDVMARRFSRSLALVILLRNHEPTKKKTPQAKERRGKKNIVASS